jgi:hypothetical protein
MASHRQIAANRRNARRSTGPHSAAGRKRSSWNSFRHGLTAGVAAAAERIKYIERLTRKIAGASTDIVTLEYARTLAQAEFDLAQIRRAKVALISRLMAFGELDKPDESQSPSYVKLFLRGLKRGECILPERVEAPATPTTEPERTAEAIRRALPELIKLDRYKRRAVARRDRAVRSIVNCTIMYNNHK